jgi:hypothetical protein
VGSNPIGSTKIHVKLSRILIQRILAGVVLAFAVLYVGDYTYFRLRAIHPTSTNPIESMQTVRVLAIPEKSGGTSYELDAQNPQQTVFCVHAIFPHGGASPCWYVKPRLNQPIPM